LPGDNNGAVKEEPGGEREISLPPLALRLSEAEWGLRRPDKQLSNSFINSKSKPPPRKQL